MKVNTNDTDSLFVNDFAKSILLILKNFVFDILTLFRKAIGDLAFYFTTYPFVSWNIESLGTMHKYYWIIYISHQRYSLANFK